MARLEATRRKLLAQFEAARRAGVDRNSAQVQEMRRRFEELHRQALGDDEQVIESLRRMIETEGIEHASGGVMHEELRSLGTGRRFGVRPRDETETSAGSCILKKAPIYRYRA
jgi:hypothetical protein